MKNLFLAGERRRKVNLPVLGNPHNDGGVNSVSHAAADTSTAAATIVDICYVPSVEGEDNDDNNGNIGDDVDSLDGGHHHHSDTGAIGRAIDPNNDTYRAVVLRSDGILSKVDKRGNTIWTRNLSTEFHDGDTSICWFDVTWVDPYLVCLSHGGAVVTVSPIDGETELVGIFERGLEAASWSPDGEVLLMVTSVDADDHQDAEEDNDDNNNDEVKNKTSCVLMTMNGQFEVLAEVSIPQFVACCASSSTNGINSTDINSKDQNRISVTWRPDGTLCAVSSVDSDDEMRKIRIYKRDTLELHATGINEDASGQLVKNLQSTQIAWAGLGCSQVLASVQRKGKRTLQVVFFEPNGLRHREFALREKSSSNTDVMSLSWNVTCDILALVVREQVDGVHDSIDKVQLWHRCNYHWYLKLEFRYSIGQKVRRIKFSDDNPNELRVILHGSEWREYDVRWDPSTVVSFENNCLAFVIDGPTLNVTPFDKALIPPPMSMKNLTLPFPANHVGFCRSTGKHMGLTLVCLSDGSIISLSCGGSNEINPTQKYKESTILWGDLKDVDPSTLRSVMPVKSDGDRLFVVAIACAACNENSERLVEITIDDINEAEPRAHVSNTYTLQGRVFRMIQWSDENPDGCLLQMNDGSFLEYDVSSEGSGLIPSEVDPLPEVCPWLAAIKDSTPFHRTGFTNEEGSQSKLVFGLSARSRLYYRDVMITDSASSFWLTLQHEFLCYVTAGSRCQMRFISLKEVNEFDPLMGMDHNLLTEGYEPRNVERGARVVAILPSHPQTILQMPRGNLEGIHPRALVLRFVMTKIMECDYGDAFRMMRKHKVDLNLIVDIDPWGFLESGVSKFLEQVPVIDHLNLFIANLQNTNVTESRFPVPPFIRRPKYGSKDGQQPPFDFATKVNQVCSAVREAMLRFESNGNKPSRYYLLPVLSTFAKEAPPRLDEALSLIKENAVKQHPSNSKKNPLFSEAAQSSIHYLAFLAEYELLFETSLGMYDYEVARAVARNSQMDPKVYLPQLKRLNSLPTYFARYEVDCRLKRYDSALRNLCESNKSQESLADFTVSTSEGNDEKKASLAGSNSFDSILNIINKHSLHTIGLEIFGHDAAKKKTILLALGEDLMKQIRPKIALSVFLSADPPHYEQAKRAARAALDWRTFFSIIESEIDPAMSADERDFHNENRRQAAREMAEEMIAACTGDSARTQQDIHMDASQVLLDYGDDVIGAVDVLIKAECWSEAHRISTSRCRQDLSKKCIDGAVTFAHVSIAAFDDRVTEFRTSSARYADVLKLRKQAVYAEGPELEPEHDETGSLFSAASNATNTSLRSTSSTSSTASGVSSVISVRSNTTFNMTGSDGVNRHRSKFNMGKKQKQRKKKPKSRRRPGSAEELQALVNVLKSTCPDAGYAKVIGETIQFLIFAQQLPVAEDLFDAYNQMCNDIRACAIERMGKTALEKIGAQKHQQQEQNDDEMFVDGPQQQQEDEEQQQGTLNHLLVELPVEKEVDALTCAELSPSITDFFSLFSQQSTTNGRRGGGGGGESLF